MFKTFIIGILSGAILAACLLYFVPAVNQHREASLISVQANGGNTESFHTNLPDDRILAGGTGVDKAIPDGLEWPGAQIAGDTQTELFKIRNRNDVVVGVASRISSSGAGSGPIVEWTLHLPARGSLYVNLQPQPDAAGQRSGSLRAGTREFANLVGSVNERFIKSDDEQGDESDFEGRIELVTALVGSHGDSEGDSE
ncbi:MAG: hypothetical protein WD795_14170 [Woeseia sp.]